MKVRSYLNFEGNCIDAINLYKDAFNAKDTVLTRFSSIPPSPLFEIPDDYKDRVLQCELYIGDEFIRMSDCGPMTKLNNSNTEKIALCFEGTVAEVRHAYDVLSKDGNIGMELEKTFFSELHGVVYDKFGVMWTLVAQ